MRLIAGLVLGAFCALMASPVFAGQGTYPQTEDELDAAYNALNWQTASQGYKLPDSHATIQLRSGQAILLGNDARRYSWLASGVEFPDTEAVLTYDTSSAQAEVYYEWREEGYVSDSDWEDVDPDALLAEYRDGTEASNEERVANGMEPMEVVGWLETPHYDKSSRTVTYSIELKDKNGDWANAFALRLGRTGYTQLTWVGSVGLLQSAGGRPQLLNDALASHSYQDGYRYADFQQGDKVAAYGITGLIAAALGAKFGKGLIAGLIAFVLAGKKIIIPALIALAGAVARFRRRLFGGADS
ncbi:MAG: DUF2167 domain-containing protein [Dongiaceae bacterium]